MKLKSKFKKLWKNNKLTILFSIVILLLIIIMIVLISPLYKIKSDSKYGDRLKDIENVKITNEETNDVKKIFENNDKVKSVKTHLSGKIYNIIIYLEDNQSHEDIMTLSESLFDVFDEDQIKYYDFQIFINSNINGTKKSIIGYKNSTSEDIFWTNNKSEVE